MRLNVFLATMIGCLTMALASSIGSQKVFAQTAQPSADSSQSAGKLLTNKLPAGYTIPPQDVPRILPGNRPDIQCLIKNDPDFVRISDEKTGPDAQSLAAPKS